MDEDADWFRPAWEAEDAPRHRTSGRSAHASEPLLPLARAQDAVGRLEATVAGAPPRRTSPPGCAPGWRCSRRRVSSPPGTFPGPGELPGLLAAARVIAAGLPGMPREDRLELAPVHVAAALWRGTATAGAARCRSGRRSTRSRDRGRGFRAWVPGLRRRGGAARRPRTRAPARHGREDLRAAGNRRSRLQGSARSPCASLWSPPARSPHGCWSRIRRRWVPRLVATGVLPEATGRDAWRAFVLA